jgi:hypothetical protein
MYISIMYIYGAGPLRDVGGNGDVVPVAFSLKVSFVQDHHMRANERERERKRE